MVGEAAIFLLTGVPFLLVMLVLIPANQTGGAPAWLGVAVGIALTTAGVGLLFAAGGLGRGSVGARRTVVVIQVALLAIALISVPLRLVDSWAIWTVVVLAASFVLYALLVHPDASALRAQPDSYANWVGSPTVRPSPWVTAGRVIGVSAGIIVVLVFAAMALMLAVVLIVLRGLGHSG